MQPINPATIVKPASNYAQGIICDGGRRLIISGQIGVRPDGSTEKGMGAQMRRAWSNLLAVVEGGGFTRQQVVKITAFVTLPGQVGLYRQLRDEYLAGHRCTATFLQVAGLASPEYMVEIEGEAVRD